MKMFYSEQKHSRPSGLNLPKPKINSLKGKGGTIIPITKVGVEMKRRVVYLGACSISCS